MEDRKEGLWKPQVCQFSWKHHFGKRVSGCACGRCVSGNDDLSMWNWEVSSLICHSQGIVNNSTIKENYTSIKDSEFKKRQWVQPYISPKHMK